MNNSVSRALRLLELVAENGGRPMRLSALAAAIDAPRSTVHNILQSLIDRRFLEQVGESGYCLGIRAFEVGSAYALHMSPTRAAHVDLVELSHEMGITAHFAVLDGAHVVYLEKEDPPGQAVRLASAVGARLPAHLTAVGKAALAFSTEADRARVDLTIRGTSRLAYTAARLASDLEDVRRNGFALDEGETAAGICCVAAPVFNARAECCGSVGISYLNSDALDGETVAGRVKSAASRISQRLGAPSHQAI
ncbi:MAG: IclR family transcriptional regulator [Streptosporangiaceae bacterium]